MAINMAEQIFIAGGYGMIGGNLAAQLRSRFPQSRVNSGGTLAAKRRSIGGTAWKCSDRLS
ncbi:Uncharacterised protein [Kluyvera cryocrescens]|uniref:Short chain dehydrogenase n=1 Tax=Kluyvera cryocrescens TaxID=580 RepID=A0A485AEF7_KLUCR|nr:Uncharacterised protein [Kluyvera cryocrescens]